jgi:hypothetical protein
VSGRAADRPLIAAAALTPTAAELANARARLASTGDSYATTYAALGMAVSAELPAVMQALRAGDVATAAAGLRRLAALDVAGAERRGQIAAADRVWRRPALTAADSATRRTAERGAR